MDMTSCWYWYCFEKLGRALVLHGSVVGRKRRFIYFVIVFQLFDLIVQRYFCWSRTCIFTHLRMHVGGDSGEPPR
jgi:hypothetical protein